MPRLDAEECRTRVGAARHAVLGTLHPERGPDLVPVVFAFDGVDRIAVPIDRVKPKGTTRLQRVVNVERDPRVAVLVHTYDDDWSSLWWVRATGRAAAARPTTAVRELLAARYPQYGDPDAIAEVLAIDVDRWQGWAAA